MQWLILALTLLVMAVLQRLARVGSPEARATLALGFLIVAAQLGGALARRLRLPRITGFLLTGLIVGRLWFHLVRPDDVDALRFIFTGALALIACAAGSQLDFARLRDRDARAAVLRLAAAAMAAPFVAVAAVVLTVSPWFPLTAHQPFRDALTVALMLGAVAAVSSPVVSWAVSSDSQTRARASFARTIVDISIVQDVAAVLLVALLLLLAQPLASGGATRPGTAALFLLRALGSIAAGIALGAGLAQYVKLIRHHVVLVLVAAAFVIAQAVRLLDLEPVLMGLAAGCTFANVPPALRAEGERLKVELARCALPVYTVFFALAGADLRLDDLRELWPWALLLAGLRVVYLRAAMRWVSRHSTVAAVADVGRYGWLGLVSQGGLVITIAAVLRRAFPEWGVTMESLIVAMVGVHLIAGPVCFQWALRRMGDVPEEAHAADDGDAAESRGSGRGGDGGGLAIVAGDSGM